MSEDFVAPPFGKAETRRGLDVRFQVHEKSTSTGWAAKDISSARWLYKIRAKSAVTTYVIGPATTPSDAVTKSATASASGWLDHYLQLGTTAYPTLSWELVEVDDDNPDASTPSTKRERVLMRWKQPIEDVPA